MVVLPSGGFQYELQILEYIAIGQQLVVLENDAHAPAKVRDVLASDFGQVEACDPPFAFDQRQFGVQGFHQRTFARPYAADQVDQFAGPDGKVHVRKHQVAIVPLFTEAGLLERVPGVVNRNVPEFDDGIWFHNTANLTLQRYRIVQLCPAFVDEVLIILADNIEDSLWLLTFGRENSICMIDFEKVILPIFTSLFCIFAFPSDLMMKNRNHYGCISKYKATL